jgi:hypothetical protein
MTASDFVSIIVGLLAAGSAVGVAVLANRSRKLESAWTLEERFRQLQEPLNFAAGDLRSRMWVLSERKIQEELRQSSESPRVAALKKYFAINTAFVIAQYLAWAEVFRLTVLAPSDAPADAQSLRSTVDAVLTAFASPPLRQQFVSHSPR